MTPARRPPIVDILLFFDENESNILSNSLRMGTLGDPLHLVIICDLTGALDGNSQLLHALLFEQISHFASLSSFRIVSCPQDRLLLERMLTMILLIPSIQLLEYQPL